MKEQAMKETLTPKKFVKVHGKATSVFVKHNGTSHYVNSGHKDGHRFGAGYSTHEEAENAARELSGKPEKMKTAQQKVAYDFHEDRI
jgi:hypothetical protein